MKKLIILALLAIVAVVQLIRSERASATPADEKPSADDKASAAAPSDQSDPAKRREYKEAAWPRYVIEPPDILSIEGVKLVPKPPYQLAPYDVVLIRAKGASAESSIDDSFAVDPDGSVNLGAAIGRIKVAGHTIDETEARLRDELAKTLQDVDVSVSLIASAGAQQITGQHLVAMDGRVNLGVYGAVYVAGMTIEEARAAVERKLSDQLESPQVAVDVLAYNSKVYYVIYKGAKFGDNVNRLPITGNETVLDAIASMGGVSSIATNTMWLARPEPSGVGDEQILPIAWNEIARGESSDTNYQLMPGDRLFIETREPEKKPALSNPTTASDPGPYSNHAAAQREQIEFDVAFLGDPHGTLADFGDLVEAGSMIGDASTTRSALRVFEKYKLITYTAAPRVTCKVGDSAKIDVEPLNDSLQSTALKGVKIEVHTRRLDDQQIIVGLSVTLEGRKRKLESVVDGSNHETTIMRLDPSADQAKGALYVVVTPHAAK